MVEAMTESQKYCVKCEFPLPDHQVCCPITDIDMYRSERLRVVCALVANPTTKFEDRKQIWEEADFILAAEPPMPDSLTGEPK